MVFYSLGSAIGGITTTVVFNVAGWGSVSVLGGAYATAALVVGIADRLRVAPDGNANLIQGRCDGLV
ncbi:hypothetical protein B2J88_44365 [Rhodococcus sp. SRB_17]|nr:hypothetical protein [Rhodococcus sp. SRB_17]